MAKQKFASVEEAKEAKVSLQEEIQIARDEKKEYFKANGLKKKEDYSADPKHGKKLGKFDSTIEKKQTEIEEINAWIKENKPSKEKAPRESKYEYPAEVVTDAEKKKYRAKMRAAAKKDEAGEGTEKPAKKKKKEEAPVETEKPAKKKKKEAEETED